MEQQQIAREDAAARIVSKQHSEEPLPWQRDGSIDSASESLALSETHSEPHPTEALSLSDLSSDEGDGNNAERDAGDHYDDRIRRSRFKPTTREDDNQRDEDDDGSDCSSLSVELSEEESKAKAHDGVVSESLSLSVSTDSDPAARELVRYLSSESEASDPPNDGGDSDARARVLIPEEEDMMPRGAPDDQDVVSAAASSLSGEDVSSSSFELQYWYVDEAHDDANDDDELWTAFAVALEGSSTPRTVDVANSDYEGALVPLNDLCPPSLVVSALVDDGYDGSASEAESEAESASSLDDSVNDGADQRFYGSRSIAQGRVRMGDESETAASLFLSSCAGSSVSSLASTSSRALDVSTSDRLVDSCSNSSVSGDDAHDQRQIENIPVHPQVSTLAPPLLNGIERANIWRMNEYVEASRTGRYGRRRSTSDDRLGLDGVSDHERNSVSDQDQDEAFDALPRLAPTRPFTRIRYAHITTQESYVSYADLAGIVDAHVVRRPGVFLDLGCGTSRVCEELVYHGYAHVIGVDKDLAAIAFQRQRAAATQLPSYLQFLPMDAAQSLLLADRCCDVILSKATLDAIAARGVRDPYPTELVATLRELIRCLKPGGVFLAVVFCDPSLVEDKEGIPEAYTGTSTAERIVQRLMTPWWLWDDVQSLLRRQLTLVRTYALGRPRLMDGKRSKPYKVLVWRRRETDRQRLQRLLLEQADAKRQEIEYETRRWLCHREHERAAQEYAMVRESRLMVLEDARSRIERAVASEAVAVGVRLQRREAFYAAWLDDERQHMTWEDDAASMRRVMEHETRRFVVETVLYGMVIGRVVDVVVAKQAASERTRQQEAVAVAAVAAVERVAEGATAMDGTWIRDEVDRLVDVALAACGVRGDTLEPVARRTRRVDPQRVARPQRAEENTAAALQNQAPAHTQGSIKVEAETKAETKAETEAVAVAVAAATVVSILSTAVASVASGDLSPHKKALEDGDTGSSAVHETIPVLTTADNVAETNDHEDANAVPTVATMFTPLAGQGDPAQDALTVSADGQPVPVQTPSENSHDSAVTDVRVREAQVGSEFEAHGAVAATIEDVIGRASLETMDTILQALERFDP